jgi:hypothetical protein
MPFQEGGERFASEYLRGGRRTAVARKLARVCGLYGLATSDDVPDPESGLPRCHVEPLYCEVSSDSDVVASLLKSAGTCLATGARRSARYDLGCTRSCCGLCNAE